LSNFLQIESTRVTKSMTVIFPVGLKLKVVIFYVFCL
jgi:hypothetical protein